MAGLDPFEERLLIALLGGGIALVFALVLGVICCRKYRLDRSGGKERKWNQQQLMYPQSGRPVYYPTGQQTNVLNMDPTYLDPARAYVGPNVNPTYASPGPQQPPQAHGYPPSGAMRQTHNVDNTAYAGMPSPQGRPAAMSYSHQV